MKKIVLFLTVFATVLLMISAATAVPVNNGKKVVENADKIKNIEEANRKLLEKIENGVQNGGIIGFILQLINLTIKIIMQVIKIVQIILGLVGSIKNLINEIKILIGYIQDLIDLFTGNTTLQSTF